MCLSFLDNLQPILPCSQTSFSMKVNKSYSCKPTCRFVNSPGYPITSLVPGYSIVLGTEHGDQCSCLEKQSFLAPNVLLSVVYMLGMSPEQGRIINIWRTVKSLLQAYHKNHDPPAVFSHLWLNQHMVQHLNQCLTKQHVTCWRDINAGYIKDAFL